MFFHHRECQRTGIRRSPEDIRQRATAVRIDADPGEVMKSLGRTLIDINNSIIKRFDNITKKRKFFGDQRSRADSHDQKSALRLAKSSKATDAAVWKDI
jgi:hypothetical protein